MMNMETNQSNHIQMKRLIQEYEDTISLISKEINKLRILYQEAKENQEKNSIKVQIQHYNSMVRDMIYSICMMEEYLPSEERHRLNQLHDSYSKQALDKRNIVGYVPEGGLKVNDPADLACNIILQEKLNEVIQLILSEKQWETLVLYYIYDMSQEEIARELGVERSTIAKRLKSSIEVLRGSELLWQYIQECG